MLQKHPIEQSGRQYSFIRDDQSAVPAFDLDRMLAAARRQWKLVALVVLLFAIAGAVRGMTVVPQYSATTQILLDRSNSSPVDQTATAQAFVQDDTDTQSQVELLASERIATMVVDALDLANDQAFNAEPEGPLGKYIRAVQGVIARSGLLPAADPPALNFEARRRVALGRLLDNISVTRVPRTYVLALSYTHPDPAIAATITNQWAESYLTSQLETKYEATRRATAWLGGRIEELRQQSIASDLAVQKFRSEHGLVGTAGALITDQSLSQLNSQLILSQADVAQAQARYDRIRSIMESGDTNAAVTESLASPIINDLRTKYLASSKQAAELAARLGNTHAHVLRLQDEMNEYKRLIFDELSRIAESYSSDLQVARKREESLRDSVAEAKRTSADANEIQVQLRELEREADTYRNLYETFLQRYQEAMQQRQLPLNEALVIAKAAPPPIPSYPAKKQMVVQFMIFGLVAGIAAAAFREYRDRYFRTGDQVRAELDLRTFGIVPAIAASKSPAVRESKEDEAHPRVLQKRSSLANYVVDHPFSSFAETMRAAKMAADVAFEHRTSKIIGLTSCLPGEGKSTVSVNFAELLASQGHRTLLIDADLRNPGLTRLVAPNAKEGLLEAMDSDRPLQSFCVVNPGTHLSVLPAVLTKAVPQSSELLGSAKADRIIKEAAENFDYVVIDLPPLAPVIDAHVISKRVDGFVVVIEWGRTLRRMVKTTLKDEPLIAEKCLGVVLNKADPTKMKYYKEYGSKDFYYAKYASYYKRGT